VSALGGVWIKENKQGASKDGGAKRAGAPGWKYQRAAGGGVPTQEEGTFNQRGIWERGWRQE